MAAGRTATCPPSKRELDVWRENRQAFAAAVDATDWTLVASAYQDLVDLPGVADAGRMLMDDELRTLAAVGKRLDDAAEVVAQPCAREARRRDRVVRELTRGVGSHGAPGVTGQKRRCCS